MKKILSALTVAVLLFSATAASARNVPEKDARKAAAYYFSRYCYRQVDESQLTLAFQTDNAELGVPSCYFYNVADGGWIIMTATTAADPVIAFNDSRSISKENMPSNVSWWLQSYNEMVVDVQKADVEQKFDDLDEWKALLSESLPQAPKDGDPLHVLMVEEWEQGDNNTHDYNLYCPEIGGVRCPVGCVATALSQIFHYYRYPVKPRSSVRYTTATHHLSLSINFDTVSFNYSLMPNMISSSTTLEQCREISKLGYCVGLAMNMDYGPDGSGAYSHNVATYMNAYFKYQSGAVQIRREGTGEDSVFVGKIRKELKQQRPVYMSGSSPIGSGADAAGHAWVCCGYRDDRPARYYMNWGWGPAYNGWYNLQANNMLIEAQGYNFIQNQTAVIGLIPPIDSTSRDIMAIEEIENIAELSAAYPNPATLSVNIPYELSSQADITVYSIDGKLVERRSLAAGSGVFEFGVSGLPAGIYIYRLGGASGKFMVQ